MKIRMEVSDDFYLEYKKIAEKKGYAVTKLSQIIFEKAVKKWVIENKIKEKKTCCVGGCEIDGEDILNPFDKTIGVFDGEDIHRYCENCYENFSQIIFPPDDSD